MDTERVESFTGSELIDWDIVQWTPENALAFFSRSTCDDDECQHVHSHFEDLRAIAFDNLIDLQSGDCDAEEIGEHLDSLEETLRTIFRATEARVQTADLTIEAINRRIDDIAASDDSPMSVRMAECIIDIRAIIKEGAK